MPMRSEPRLGITGWPFRHWPLVRTLDKLRQYSIKHLDFWPEMQGNLSDDSVIRLAQDVGICLYCYNIPDRPRLGTPNSADQVRTLLLAGLTRASRLAIRNVQFYGAPSPGRSVVNTVRECAEVLKPVVEAAANGGLTLWFENDYDESGTDRDQTAINRTPEALWALLEAVGSPSLRVTYDPCNFVIAGAEAFPFAYELLKPHIANVHIKDARRFDWALLGAPRASTLLTSDVINGPYLPVRAGAGSANLDAILRRLAADGYVGVVTLDALCKGEQADEFFPHDLRFVRERLQPNVGTDGEEGGD